MNHYSTLGHSSGSPRQRQLQNLFWNHRYQEPSSAHEFCQRQRFPEINQMQLQIAQHDVLLNHLMTSTLHSAKNGKVLWSFINSMTREGELTKILNQRVAHLHTRLVELVCLHSTRPALFKRLLATRLLLHLFG